MNDLFSASRAHPCERLARIEGQSNFLALLGDQMDGGPRKEDIAADTTEDMAALAMIRHSAIPEALEAYWGASQLHRYALCQCVMDAILQRGPAWLRGGGSSLRWLYGAILDAFDEVYGIGSPSIKDRARLFHIRWSTYLDARNDAERLFREMESDARPRWIRARFGQ